MLAEIPQAVCLCEHRGRGRDEHLPAVSRRGDARRAMNVRTDVALVGEERRPRVQSHTHPDPAGGERLGEGFGSRECSQRRWEGEEEGVALRIDLDAAFRGAGLPHELTMLGKHLRIGLGAELVQEPRRAFDVGEEERDRACREVRAHGPDHVPSGSTSPARAPTGAVCGRAVIRCG